VKPENIGCGFRVAVRVCDDEKQSYAGGRGADKSIWDPAAGGRMRRGGPDGHQRAQCGAVFLDSPIASDFRG